MMSLLQPDSHSGGIARMHDGEKSRDQLLQELVDLRKRLDGREVLESGHQPAGTDLRAARQRLEYLLAVSPSIIYCTQVSGDYGCTFVSQNLHAIMGYTTEEMTTDLKFWPARLHPDDAPGVYDQIDRLIGQGGGSLECRFQHRQGHYLYAKVTGTVAGTTTAVAVCFTSMSPDIGAFLRGVLRDSPST
jgi:PAS domain-containing protein